MIKSFVHKGLEDYYYDGTKKGIKPQHAQKLEDILDRLDAAVDVKDMHYPGSGLHQLKGKKKRNMGCQSNRKLESNIQF